MNSQAQPTASPLTDAVVTAAIDHAIEEARRQGTTPKVVIGTTPPVVQPGRPPMSSKAVDDTARMLGASVLIATGGGATTAILWASGYANPVVVAVVFGAPTALVLALSRLARRARGVLPHEIHHHYEGTVRQQYTHSETRGVWAKTTNGQ